MDILCWGGCGNKQLFEIQFSGHLRYDWLKLNIKSNNFIYSVLEALFDNVEGNISSTFINLCHYIDECYEDEFVSAAGDTGLTFFLFNVYY